MSSDAKRSSVRPNFFDNAECRGSSIDIFFPPRHQPLLIKKAREVCASCPVMQECREYSLDLHEQFELFGIWGGWSHLERITYLRNNNRVAARAAYDAKIWNL